MKAFIEISKMVRHRYKTQLPFIYAMAKGPMRDDLKKQINRYETFKIAAHTA